LVDKVDTISDFINEGIYDSDLPFILGKDEREGDSIRTLSRMVEGKKQTIELFLRWRDVDMESFHHQQWKVNIPVFHVDEKRNSKEPLHTLSDRAILPFLDVVKAGRGYSGAVHKVEIHPRHHNQPCEPVSRRGSLPNLGFLLCRKRLLI